MYIRVCVAVLASLTMAFAGLYLQAASRVRGLKNKRSVAFTQRDEAVRELESLRVKFDAQEKEIAQLKTTGLEYLAKSKKIKDEAAVMQENVKGVHTRLKETEAKLQQKIMEGAGLKEKIKSEVAGELADKTKQIAVLQKKVDELSSSLKKTEGEKRASLALSYYNTGVTLSGGGDYRKAVEAFEKAVANDDANADAHYNAALIYAQILQEPEKAKPHLVRFLALAPNSPDAIEVRRMLGE
jgi:tetratricopeptide (TPR) repeat protein